MQIFKSRSQIIRGSGTCNSLFNTVTETVSGRTSKHRAFSCRHSEILITDYRIPGLRADGIRRLLIHNILDFSTLRFSSLRINHRAESVPGGCRSFEGGFHRLRRRTCFCPQGKSHRREAQYYHQNNTPHPPHLQALFTITLRATAMFLEPLVAPANHDSVLHFHAIA